MGLGDHDKSALQRQLLGDLAALIAIREYLSQAGAKNLSRVDVLEAEIQTLVDELWPT